MQATKFEEGRGTPDGESLDASSSSEAGPWIAAHRFRNALLRERKLERSEAERVLSLSRDQELASGFCLRDPSASPNNISNNTKPARSSRPSLQYLPKGRN